MASDRVGNFSPVRRFIRPLPAKDFQDGWRSRSEVAENRKGLVRAALAIWCIGWATVAGEPIGHGPARGRGFGTSSAHATRGSHRRKMLALWRYRHLCLPVWARPL
jgi:hypothetical protein